MASSKFIGVNSLMKTLEDKKLIKSGDNQINVFFDEFFANHIYKHNWTIKPIDFEVIDYKKHSRHISYAEFKKSFSETEWINIGKQLDKYFKEFDKTPKLRKLMILTKQMPFNDSFYHPLKIVLSEISQDSYEQLKKERTDILNEKVNNNEGLFKEDNYEDLFID